ncbi:MAG: RluA family pseudouridine synthase [Clostridia bacterium]|nr:RluA family pseudouridine synthase [Clostridia bacterium]
MIVYKDNEIVVCEKPYGVSSQESSGENMISLIEKSIGGQVFPVHRLDTQTTGLIVYARTKASASELSRQITEGKIEKSYLTICHGALSESGEMIDYLYHDRIKNKSFVVQNKRKGSKDARLSYACVSTKDLGECGTLSLLMIRLYTGRTHQIRVQLSSRGNPLYGDGKYGAKDNDKIALHSSYLSFFHPTTKKRLTFTSSPKDGIWSELVNELKTAHEKWNEFMS